MTKDWGMKISRNHHDVKTAKPNELAFSSAYGTLKVHTSGSGSLTDSSRTVTIPHNLGYVPVFMVHNTMDAGFGGNLFSSSDYVLSPSGLSGVLPNPSVGINDDLFAYADSTNLYIKAQENFGKVKFYPANTYDLYSNWLGGVNSILIGNSATYGTLNSALRVTGVSIPKNSSIYQATLNLYYFEKGSGTGNLAYSCVGIDEDNTSNFASDPWGRPNTDASNSGQITLPNAPAGFGINVKSILEEIVARNGWVSGNAVGFKIQDNSSPNDVWMHGTYDSYEIYYNLDVILNSTIANYKYTIFKNQLE